MTDRFNGRVVLVSGAAGGIGLATARAFAREGASVVLADRNAQGVASAAEAIRAEGGKASAFAVDVTDFAACEAMVAHAVATFGGLHIAFNNAGIPSDIGGEFEDFTIENWDRLISVNLSAMFYAMKAEAPALKASGGTAIINTASVASFIGARGMAAYVTSKHGVAGLTKAAALDFIDHGIRVNAVCPGLVDTPMLAPAIADPQARAAISAQAPIGRLATPEEIAAAVLFLASDVASYMVGTLLRVDGGLTLP